MVYLTKFEQGKGEKLSYSSATDPLQWYILASKRTANFVVSVNWVFRGFNKI